MSYLSDNNYLPGGFIGMSKLEYELFLINWLSENFPSASVGIVKYVEVTKVQLFVKL